MQRADSFEKTLMLGKIEGRTRTLHAADESVQTALTTEDKGKPPISRDPPQQIFTKDQQWQLQLRSPAQPLAANSLNAHQQKDE